MLDDKRIMPVYNENNIFAKIIKKEIPCKIIYQNEYTIAFHDIAPKAKTHVLVIPKGQYIDSNDFYTNASSKEILQYCTAIVETVKLLNLRNGYRLIANNGINSGQEVPHFHTHILGGQKLGPLLAT